MREKPASNASDNEEQLEREMDDLSEVNVGPGWTIPDGNSTGSTAQEEEESESSKDGSQRVHQSMFTDSDGGSTIKMNEQCHSDATQTGEDAPGSHSVDPSNMDTEQSNSDDKAEGQFIVTERELDKDDRDDDSETMSETSDIVNNNKTQSPREISQEEQRSLLESLPSSNKLRTVASSGSLFSEEGYQTFPGAEQSQELLKREVYGHEDDNESEAVSSCTDTSNLAQLIVDHVLENVVGSVQDESDSDSSVKQIVENLENALETEENEESMDQREEEQVLEDKGYASKMELDADIKIDEEALTDFQLDDPQPMVEEVREERDDKVIDGGDEEIEVKLPEDNTVFDSEDRAVEGAQANDQLLPESGCPGAKQTTEVDKENVDGKQFDNGGQSRLLKSKDSGVSMSYAGESIRNSQSVGAVASTSSNVSDRISDPIPERINPSESLQEYDTQRPSDIIDEPMAEKPYEEDSTFKQLTPEEATISSAEISVPESFVDQDNGNLAYTAVSSTGYTEPSSIRADQSSGFLASQETDSQPSYERNSSSAKPIQTPPRMVLRTKQDFVVSGNRSEQDTSSNVKGQGRQHQREVEMHREQLILDKVRKDMAAKEREMRRQIDREMTERMERARLQQELLSNGGEYYRSENDLSLSSYDQSTEFDTTESSRLKYVDQSSSRSPINAVSRSMPARSSSDLRVSEEELIRRYQRELSRSEQRHYDVSGIDTYATLQNQQSRNNSVSLEDQLRMEGMSYADINRSERGMPSNIYSSYNIPPPQYNVSTSFGAQNSSNTSSDLEAPPPKSGSVPPFKTLHEQQIGWMRMFKTLEEQHHNELKNQYRQHQETIFSMQHQIESELLNQQQTLKQKLSAHKEALSNNASPIKPHQDRRLDHSQLASQMLESTRVDNSHKKSASPKSSPNARHTLHSDRHASPPWKDIYREIRGKGVDSDRETEDNEEETTPIRRSLEDDFLSTSSMLRQPGFEEIRPPPKKFFDPPTSELPRGSMYSSAMPTLRKSNVQNSARTPSPRQTDRSSPHVASSNDLSQTVDRTDSRLLESLADPPMESLSSEDSASQSYRAHLREKHAKHLLDLREYYEQEIQELRSALSRSDDITNRSPFKRVANENQALITENHSLKHTNEELESQLNKVLRENRELEQKIHGLERRASEYADCYKEAQDKISTFRNKVEELQYQNRTMEDQVQHLECQVKNQADAIKHYKKSQDEQMEVLQKDRNAYHKLSDKYDNLEREFNILKESFNSTENKLYDARSEVVELNRTVSKLELENKRLGRENDNIRYKLTQSANAVTMQGNADDSYSSPGRLRHQSPARESSLQKSYSKSANCNTESAHARSKSQEIPVRLLGDRPLDHDFHHDHQIRSRGQINSFCEEIETNPRVREHSIERRPKNTCNSYDEVEEIEKSHQRPRSAPGSRNAQERQMSPGVDQTSPVLRAERELYKLREIMRQAEQVVEASPPQQPKLQKKFYGSESALSSSKSDSGSSVHKSDSSSSLKLKKKKSVNTSPVKSPKVRTSKSSRFQDSDSMSPPSKAKFETSPGEFGTPTRFDISAMERSSSRRQHSDSLPTRDTGSKPRQSQATRDKRNGELRGGAKPGRDRKPLKAEKDIQVPNGTVDDTLAKMKEGEFLSRPGWEDVYTSMAKPKSDSKVTPVKQTVKNRMDNISDLEARYDALQTEKRTLESKLSRVPTHGKGRQEQENLENKLDTLEKELGSVRMSLKRYHVLKTSI